jgi:hypothetical protein
VVDSLRLESFFEIESKSILSGYLDHRLTQDVGINIRDKEGIMDGEWAPPTPPDHPGHHLYGHVRILTTGTVPRSLNRSSF